MSPPPTYPREEIAYYRARCGSCYQVTITQTHRTAPERVMQARRSTYAQTFSPAYPTTTEEVARLVFIGAFVQVAAP